MHRKLFFIILFFSYAIIHAQWKPSYVELEKASAGKKMSFRPSSQTGNYDWIYQRLDLFVHPGIDTIHGNTSVYFKFYNNSDHLTLDLSNRLQVESVQYHGQPVSFNQTSTDELNIRFPSAIPAGNLDSVQIVYAGHPQNHTGFGSFLLDSHNGVPVIWTLSEPYGAKDWWPCKQDLIDKLDSIDVILHYPREINGEIMQGVSNGIIVLDTAGGGIRTTHWRHRYPIPAYLVAIAVTNYRKYSHTAGIFTSFPVDNYVYPEDYSYASNKTPVIEDLIAFYESLYGEYTFSHEKYGHAQFGWGGGMEHSTITFIVDFTRGLMAHELAHQWWGDDVTCGSWSDIWINEGFATYSEALTQEYFDGERAFYYWKRYADNLISREPHGSVYVYGNDTLDVGRVFEWRLSYLKGAMVLHMLRKQLGDNTFFLFLRRFRALFSHAYATTEDFKNTLENETGRDWDEFFDDWIYGKGFPSFNVQWQYISGTTYHVQIDQYVSDSSVDFFETPLKLRFKSGANNRIFDTIVELTPGNRDFYIRLDTLYDQLEVDPEYDIIRGQINTTFTGSFDWGNDTVRIFPNPAVSHFTVLVKNPGNIREMFLFDAGGKIIRRNIQPNCSVPTDNLSSGVYFLELVNSKGLRQSYKILVKQ
jgi:aminopeptidase N